MDYKTYLDFVLCMENRQEPQSLHYLFRFACTATYNHFITKKFRFRILDFEHSGYLTSFTLNYFFKGIQEQILQNRSVQMITMMADVNFQDVKDEIFDMIKPVDPLRITLKDLINR